MIGNKDCGKIPKKGDYTRIGEVSPCSLRLVNRIILNRIKDAIDIKLRRERILEIPLFY